MQPTVPLGIPSTGTFSLSYIMSMSCGKSNPLLGKKDNYRSRIAYLGDSVDFAAVEDLRC